MKPKHTLANDKCVKCFNDGYAKGKADGYEEGWLEATNAKLKKGAQTDHEHFAAGTTELIRCEKCYAKGKETGIVEERVRLNENFDDVCRPFLMKTYYAKGKADADKETSDACKIIKERIKEDEAAAYAKGQADLIEKLTSNKMKDYLQFEFRESDYPMTIIKAAIKKATKEA